MSAIQSISDDFIAFVTNLLVAPAYLVLFLQLLHDSISSTYDPVKELLDFVKTITTDNKFLKRLISSVVHLLTFELKYERYVGLLFIYSLLYVHSKNLMCLPLYIFNLCFISKPHLLIVVLFVNTCVIVFKNIYVRFTIILFYVLVFVYNFFDYSLDNHTDFFSFLL